MYIKALGILIFILFFIWIFPCKSFSKNRYTKKDTQKVKQRKGLKVNSVKEISKNKAKDFKMRVLKSLAKNKECSLDKKLKIKKNINILFNRYYIDNYKDFYYYYNNSKF